MSGEPTSKTINHYTLRVTLESRRPLRTHNAVIFDRLGFPTIGESYLLRLVPVRSPERKKPAMPPRPMSSRSRARKRSRVRSRAKKKDPIFVDGQRPRPMYVDYKDVELLKKMINRQGRIVGRRKSGCTAASQHAVTAAVKRARYMALLPYVGD